MPESELAHPVEMDRGSPRAVLTFKGDAVCIAVHGRAGLHIVSDASLARARLLGLCNWLVGTVPIVHLPGPDKCYYTARWAPSGVFSTLYLCCLLWFL